MQILPVCKICMNILYLLYFLSLLLKQFLCLQLLLPFLCQIFSSRAQEQKEEFTVKCISGKYFISNRAAVAVN